MKEIFTQSEKMQQEYCCTILRIGEVNPVPNSDFLGQTLVNGNNIVIRKDEVKEGDIMIYAPIETQLNKEFLGANNLFEIGEREKNSNYKEVQALLDAGDKDGACKKCGFFNKHGRVRLIRLRKCPSFGFLFTLDALGIWKPELKDIDLEPLIGTDFDTILGELFVKVYVPYVPESHKRGPKYNHTKKVRTFDRMVAGEFFKHYDTTPLQKNIHLVSPDDVVYVSVKLHGTSAIFGNLKCRVPHQIHTKYQWWNDFVNYLITLLPEKWQGITEEYQDIYSSRNVIKNQFIQIRKFWKRNKILKNSGYYSQDIWGEYNELLKAFIPQGMTLYGEIVGYLSGSQEMIQSGYDYGCAEGENMLMLYRITTTLPDGGKYEWNVSEVREWTVKFRKEHPELANRIHPIDTLFHGSLSRLYPNLDPELHWNESVLEAMKVEKAFGMEELEPLCKNKVPREGIVLRIDNDPVLEAFKLKCVAFLEREAKEVDAGKVDVEMAQGYESSEEEL